MDYVALGNCTCMLLRYMRSQTVRCCVGVALLLMRTGRILARGSHVSTLCIEAGKAPRGSTVPVPVSRKHIEDMFVSCTWEPNAVDARERQLLQLLLALLVS